MPLVERSAKIINKALAMPLAFDSLVPLRFMA